MKNLIRRFEKNNESFMNQKIELILKIFSILVTICFFAFNLSWLLSILEIEIQKIIDINLLISILFAATMLFSKVYKYLNQQKDSNDKLVESQKRAEEENVTKSEFLATMSHEIRTPMNGIVGFLEILSDSELSEEQRECVEEAKKTTDILLYIINDVLDFSKIEAGKLSFEAIDFNIRTIVEDSILLQRFKAESRGLTLHAFIDTKIPEVLKGDPARIRQILDNLIGNAVKFTSKGEVNISVESKNSKEGFVELLFEVEDTGIGISEEKLKTLFNPFVQADASVTRKYGGTGLGLAITKKIIELLNGKIWAESKLGCGTKFLFKLGFQIGIPDNIQVDNQKFNWNIKILIVDENKMNRKIVRSYLEYEGCVVDEAANVSEILGILIDYDEKKADYDLIILDNHMPELSALDVAKILKRVPQTQNTPILLLSSHSTKNELDNIKDCSTNTYLIKPIKKKELLEKITSLLNSETKIQVNEHNIKINNLNEVNDEDKKTIKILLAEDNDTNRNVFVRMLTKIGYTCDNASNGQEAVEICKKNKYDIIFMDCHMPIMDGIEATKNIRELINKNQKTVIVAVTADALMGDKEKYIAEGMTDYISKPIKLKDIQEILYKYMNHKTAIKITNENSKNSNDINAKIQIFMDETSFSYEESRNLYDEFFKGLNETIFGIENFINLEDFSSLKLEVHTLKGASGNLRLNELKEIANQLQIVVENKNIEEIRSYFSRIKEISEQLIAEYYALEV